MTSPRLAKNRASTKLGKVNPPLAIVYRDIAELQTDSKNPRVHSEKQIQQVARSIEAFGFNVPFLVDRKLKLIAGHGRLAACTLLGINKVPTICLDHLTENQVRAFMIAVILKMARSTPLSYIKLTVSPVAWPILPRSWRLWMRAESLSFL
jgi:hypothetical protein